MIAGQRRPRQTLPTQSCIQRLPGARTGMGISVLDPPHATRLAGSRRIVKIDCNSNPATVLRESTRRAQDGPHSGIAATGFDDGQPQEHRDTAPRRNRSRATKRAA